MIESLPYFSEVIFTACGAIIGMQLALYHKLNKFTTALTILCREHAKNHNQSEINL